MMDNGGGDRAAGNGKDEETNVRLERAPVQLKPVLRNLLTEYLLELFAIQGLTAPRDDEGHVPYHWFDVYWQAVEPERIPFGLWLGDELAGFCLLRDTGDQWSVAEFYVLPTHRRKGIGASAVAAVKEFCRCSGKHSELEANTLLANTAALAFWRRQGFVTVSEDEELKVNIFRL